MDSLQLRAAPPLQVAGLGVSTPNFAMRNWVADMHRTPCPQPLAHTHSRNTPCIVLGACGDTRMHMRRDVHLDVGALCRVHAETPACRSEETYICTRGEISESLQLLHGGC